MQSDLRSDMNDVLSRLDHLNTSPAFMPGPAVVMSGSADNAILTESMSALQKKLADQGEPSSAGLYKHSFLM